MATPDTQPTASPATINAASDSVLPKALYLRGHTSEPEDPLASLVQNGYWYLRNTMPDLDWHALTVPSKLQSAFPGQFTDLITRSNETGTRFARLERDKESVIDNIASSLEKRFGKVLCSEREQLRFMHSNVFLVHHSSPHAGQLVDTLKADGSRCQGLRIFCFDTDVNVSFLHYGASVKDYFKHQLTYHRNLIRLPSGERILKALHYKKGFGTVYSMTIDANSVLVLPSPCSLKIFPKDSDIRFASFVLAPLPPSSIPSHSVGFRMALHPGLFWSHLGPRDHLPSDYHSSVGKQIAKLSSTDRYSSKKWQKVNSPNKEVLLDLLQDWELLPSVPRATEHGIEEAQIAALQSLNISGDVQVPETQDLHDEDEIVPQERAPDVAMRTSAGAVEGTANQVSGPVSASCVSYDVAAANRSTILRLRIKKPVLPSQDTEKGNDDDDFVDDQKSNPKSQSQVEPKRNPKRKAKARRGRWSDAKKLKR